MIYSNTVFVILYYYKQTRKSSHFYCQPSIFSNPCNSCATVSENPQGYQGDVCNSSFSLVRTNVELLLVLFILFLNTHEEICIELVRVVVIRGILLSWCKSLLLKEKRLLLIFLLFMISSGLRYVC